jgi:hypothetical protein
LSPPNFDVLRNSWWLYSVGIGLLLLGLAFLFKYAIDKGWINEHVRIGFGLMLGSTLLGVGLWLNKEYKGFSQVLLGGSIAAYYITGYAAYQLYHLVKYNVAFGFMLCVTVLAFALSIRPGGVVLSLVGAIGGFATPFLLFTGERNIPGLIGYTCLVIAGTSAIFIFKMWYSLLLVSFIGGWWIFIVAYFNAIFGYDATKYDSDRLALQGAAAFSLLAFWGLPLLREWLSERYPHKWPRGSDIFLMLQQETKENAEQPSLVLAFSAMVWEDLVSQHSWGWIAVIGGAVYWLVAYGLRNSILPLAHTHAFMASVLLAIGLYSLLFVGNGSNNWFNNWLFIALAVEAAALLVASGWFLRESMLAAGHLLFLVIGLLLLQRLVESNSVGAFSILDPQRLGTITPLLNWNALADLTVIVLAMAVSFIIQQQSLVLAYRLAAHVSLLWWVWRELSLYDDGKAYITIAWGAYALALLVTGVALNRNRVLLNTGIATLFLVVAKLFLVDLTLDEVWRIILFLSFGGLFLLISYYFQRLMKREDLASNMKRET